MVLVIISIIVAVLVCIYLFMVFPARMTKKQREVFSGRSYAHRGLFDNEENIPENSLAAFERAIQNGYACELDVQFTKDRQLIVFHDNDYKRACGVDKNVWELTLDEIRDFRLFGSGQKIPLFSEVLELVSGRQPLIVEIKAEGITTEWYYELCADAVKLLRDYKGEFCVECFHPMVVRWFYKNAGDIVRGQLVTSRKSSPSVPANIAFPYIRLLLNFLNRPHFIACNDNDRNLSLRIVQKLGALSIIWTVCTPERAKQLYGMEDAVIFDHCRPAPRYK